MRTLTIQVERDTLAALGRAGKSFLRAMKTGRYQGEFRSFESPAALFRVFTPARWMLIEALQASGPSSLRALARQLVRDVKSVHRDVHALMDQGLIEKDESGRFLVPFARIHTQFDMSAAPVA